MMSVTVMNSIFSPYTVDKGSLRKLIELELERLSHDCNKLVFSTSQLVSQWAFPFCSVIES